MAAIGQRNSLRVLRDSTHGFYLDGGEHGEILLPGRYVPKNTGPGAELDVFVYLDSEDRLVATTETPRVMVGEFAFLPVIGANARIGAFLDWGLSKDLLLPIAEQARRVKEGDWVVAYVFVDPRSGRIVASTRLNRFVDRTPPVYQDGQAVNLLVAEQTDLGFRTIIDNAHFGLLYSGDLTMPLKVGRRLEGFIGKVREDGKIDLTLNQAVHKRVATLTEQILDALKAGDGHLDFDDGTPPEVIRAAFQTSKKAFKQALGALFRERKIRFCENGGIELAK